jgi:probable blue pigment (indigoidine) exporter
MPRSHVLGMCFVTAILAVCFALIKIGLDYAPPLLFGGLRALIGGGALLGLAAVAPGPVLPPRRTWPGLMTLSVVATTITFAAMFLSPGRTEAGIASAAGNLQPFVTLLLAAFFLGETLTAAKSTAMLLGLAGIALISYPTLTGSGVLGVSGVTLALTVSITSSIGSVLVKHMQLGRSLLAVTAWQLLFGGLFLLGLSGVIEDVSRLDLNLTFVALLLFLSLAGTAFTTALWYALLQVGDVGRLATFFYLIPVFGLIIAALIFGEDMSAPTLGGIVALLLAVGVIATQKSSVPAGPTDSKLGPEPVERMRRIP